MMEDGHMNDAGEAPERRASASPSQTLNRAVKLLQWVSGSRGAGMALSDLVRASGLTKPTARRLLIALIENGLIDQDPHDRRYHMGPETYALGMLATERYGIHRLAAESLVSIAAMCGDAALLTVQRGLETVCLAREEGSFPLRSHVLQAGDRHPLGVGAAGMALLAGLPDDEVEAVLTHHAGRLAAHYPSQSPEALRRLVTETRARGYSLNAGSVFKGSWGIAVAFDDVRGNTRGALTIAGVESRFTPARIDELAVLLLEQKKRLEQRLQRSAGAPPARRTPTHKGDESHV
jgi:DNA-binding IclR family transcriptional regulator